jgi:hypothetical protein
MARGAKTLSIKMPKPKKAPKIKAPPPAALSTPRQYAKAEQQDPTEFSQFGFGQTGLTGES